MSNVVYVHVTALVDGTVDNRVMVDTDNIRSDIAADPLWINPAPEDPGIGWSYSNGTFTAPPEEDLATKQTNADGAVDRKLERNEIDLAILMTMADMWAQLNSISVSEARTQVRNRVKHNLRALRGIN